MKYLSIFKPQIDTFIYLPLTLHGPEKVAKDIRMFLFLSICFFPKRKALNWMSTAKINSTNKPIKNAILKAKLPPKKKTSIRNLTEARNNPMLINYQQKLHYSCN